MEMIISASRELYGRKTAAPRQWAWRIVCSSGDFCSLTMWLGDRAMGRGQVVVRADFKRSQISLSWWPVVTIRAALV